MSHVVQLSVDSTQLDLSFPETLNQAALCLTLPHAALVLAEWLKESQRTLFVYSLLLQPGALSDK